MVEWIIEQSDGPYIFRELWREGNSSGSVDERIPGPRTRRQHERWEYREANRLKREKRQRDWDCQWESASTKAQEIYGVLQECIDEAVPDANGTNEFVVLKYARRITE